MNYRMDEAKKKEATFRDDLNYESIDNLVRKAHYPFKKRLRKWNMISIKQTQKAII